MASITTRHLSDDTHDVLAERTKRSGRSWQEYLSAELERLAREPNVDDWIASARHFASTMEQAAADRILSDVDADRR